MPKEYPALMVEDNGYAAILRGHGLPGDALEAAEVAMIGKPEDGWFTQVEEVCFDWVPRVKWCSRHPLSGGWSCDREGEWHGHWFEVRDTDIEACHFTIIRHTDLDPNEVTGSTEPDPNLPEPCSEECDWCGENMPAPTERSVVTAPVKVIPTPYATMHVCDACDVCGNLGCLDSHGLCDAVNPEQTAGCFREPLHEGLHTFEIGRAVTQPHEPYPRRREPMTEPKIVNTEDELLQHYGDVGEAWLVIVGGDSWPYMLTCTEDGDVFLQTFPEGGDYDNLDERGHGLMWVHEAPASFYPARVVAAG